MVACGDDDNGEDIGVSQESLSKRVRHLSAIMGHFWKRWRRVYLLLLRECHRYCEGNDSPNQHKIGDIVVVHDDSHPRGFWKLAKIESLLKEADQQVRGATVQVSSKRSKTRVPRCPLKCLYPLEIDCEVKANQDKDVTSHNDNNQGGETQPAEVTSSTKRPRRAAALRAENWMKAVLQDNL